jgi:hypothetical protein
MGSSNFLDALESSVTHFEQENAGLIAVVATQHDCLLATVVWAGLAKSGFVVQRGVIYIPYFTGIAGHSVTGGNLSYLNGRLVTMQAPPVQKVLSIGKDDGQYDEPAQQDEQQRQPSNAGNASPVSTAASNIEVT